MDANAISALAAAGSAISAAVAVAVAYWSVRLSSKALSSQERHNHLTVRPVPFVGLADFDHMIGVKVTNDGSGPLIIKRIVVTDKTGTSYEDVVSWMPPLPDGIHWSQFTSHILDRALLPASALILLQLKGNSEEERFSDFQKECRKVLAGLTVQLWYTDVYENIFAPYSRQMDWFARERQGEPLDEVPSAGTDEEMDRSGREAD
jgi:hypothetical protein